MQSVEETEKEIIKEFEDFFDWKERYQYLIELGEELPLLQESEKIEENKVHGCQSQVWLVHKVEQEKIIFHADSDSTIVKGILAILLRVFSERTPQEILNAPLDFIEEIGLSKHLSMNRSNGLSAMIAKIKEIAKSNL